MPNKRKNSLYNLFLNIKAFNILTIEVKTNGCNQILPKVITSWID